MHPLFTPYREYAIFVITPRVGDGPFTAHWGCGLNQKEINSYRHLLQGTAPGTFETEDAARDAALKDARLAIDRHFGA